MSIDKTKCGKCGTPGDENSFTQTFQYDPKSKNPESKLIAVTCEACFQAEKIQRFTDTGRLSTRLVQDAAMARWHHEHDGRPLSEPHRKVMDANDNLTAIVKEFERIVWFGGLQAIVKPARERGFSIEEGTFKLMTYSMAGRCMLTLGVGDDSITLITDESSSRACMGIQGYDCTEVVGREALNKAIHLWQKGKRPKVDQEVHIAGF